MEHAEQTLHDFVLNLLSDSQALASFEQDPAAVLDHAGLSDISAADVQEVIPLVVDFVPAHADALDSIMSQLPVDSVETGQLGAIQQLQFVTQALGGIPSFSAAGSFEGGDTHSTWQLGGADNSMWGATALDTPLGAGGSTLGGDLQHGMNSAVWSSSPAGDMHANATLPGLDSLPTLGGGLPSGFSALSDVTDALDGHVSSIAGSMTDNAINSANLMAGVADFAAGGLVNPAELTNALANPAAAFSALTGTADALLGNGAASLPAPAGAMAGEAVHSVDAATQGVASQVTSHLPATGGLGNVGGLGGHLPALDPSHAMSTVQGVVGNLTGNLPTGGLGNLGNLGDLSHTVDPSHAVSTVQGVVGDVTSHSPVSDITGTTGAGNLLGSVDHVDAGSDLSHVTSDLHLPSLF
ncbi:MAG TPA: IniB N-terminal domain-containing protein [Pseudonocardiaceae bacterium]|jgi:hypothetical protein|nr:IniB N-terminal domain-containing protein [Pseudonocardiaceae bacterium]